MASSSADRRELMMPKKNQERETSPERTKILILTKAKSEQKVGVVYYLTRNGQFEHPHFLEVPLLSPQGLQLQDVTNRLNRLRGEGMAGLYSWSSKRRYKNGFVWQDLSETDFIQPCNGHEYILKGSLLLETSQSFRSYDTTSSRPSRFFSDIVSSSSEDSNSPVIRKKNRSWTTFDDLDEYKVYKAKMTGETASRPIANVSTQTDGNGRKKIDGSREIEQEALGTIELSREASSKLSLKCSSKTLESLERSVKDYGSSGSIKNQPMENDGPSGRRKSSMVLMKLIGCGSK